jgi:hypothetical protein
MPRTEDLPDVPPLDPGLHEGDLDPLAGVDHVRRPGHLDGGGGIPVLEARPSRPRPQQHDRHPRVLGHLVLELPLQQQLLLQAQLLLPNDGKGIALVALALTVIVVVLPCCICFCFCYGGCRCFRNVFVRKGQVGP